jgi:hypothetical protein
MAAAFWWSTSQLVRLRQPRGWGQSHRLQHGHGRERRWIEPADCGLAYFPSLSLCGPLRHERSENIFQDRALNRSRMRGASGAVVLR